MSIKASVRSRLPSFTLPQIFFVVGFAQAAVVIALYSYVFAEWQLFMAPDSYQVPASVVIPTNLSIIIFACIYEIILIGDAVYTRNSVQVTAVCFINIGLIATTALSRIQLKRAIASMRKARTAKGNPLVHLERDPWANVKVIMIAIPIILSVGTVLMFGVLYKVLQHFSWIKYQYLNGDLLMRRRYLMYQGYISLLKIDLFMVVAFLTIYTVPHSYQRDWEYYASIGGVVAFIIITLGAASLVKRESMLGMITITIVFLASMAYFIYKLWLMYAPIDIHYEFETTLTVATQYACLSLFFLALTVACGIACMYNFGHGLRKYLVDEKFQGRGWFGRRISRALLGGRDGEMEMEAGSTSSYGGGGVGYGDEWAGIGGVGKNHQGLLAHERMRTFSVD